MKDKEGAESAKNATTPAALEMEKDSGSEIRKYDRSSMLLRRPTSDCSNQNSLHTAPTSWEEFGELQGKHVGTKGCDKANIFAANKRRRMDASNNISNLGDGQVSLSELRLVMPGIDIDLSDPLRPLPN